MRPRPVSLSLSLSLPLTLSASALSLSLTLAARFASFWPHADAANLPKTPDDLTAAARAVCLAARGRSSILKSVRAKRLKFIWRRTWPGASTRA